LAAITPEAPGILLRNAYGWFERVARGTYRLSEAGHAALLAHRSVEPLQT
jgi:hypothetical protein